jgi:hypothetical protein
VRLIEVLWVVPGKAANVPPFGRVLEMVSGAAAKGDHGVQAEEPVDPPAAPC